MRDIIIAVKMEEQKIKVHFSKTFQEATVLHLIILWKMLYKAKKYLIKKMQIKLIF